MDGPKDDYPPDITEALFRAGLVNHKSILEAPNNDVLNIGYISHSQVKNIIYLAAKKISPICYISGSELEALSDRRWNSIGTGCQLLDQLLRGGVLTRGVTELAGQSGCGKTQLCLQLAITVQLPLFVGGLAAGAVFICTEDRFPSVRLNQLIKCFPLASKYPNIDFGNNIFVEHIADTVDLKKCVSERLPQLMKQHSIGLVIIDSVAAVFRAEYAASEALQRAKDLRALASQLHLIAHNHKIAVLCVNQVSDIKRGDRSVTVPALGLAWANLVTCRLQMFRNEGHRQLQVMFAPHLPRCACQYNITNAGVMGVGNLIDG